MLTTLSCLYAEHQLSVVNNKHVNKRFLIMKSRHILSDDSSEHQSINQLVLLTLIFGSWLVRLAAGELYKQQRQKIWLVQSHEQTNKQTKTVWRDSLDSAGRRRPTLWLFQRRTECRRAAAPPGGGTLTRELRPPPPEEQYRHVTANILTNTILLQTWKILHLKT